LRREHTYVVGPLALPDLDRLDRGHAREALAQVPSVALFLDRARAADPEFELDDDSARPVSELCIRMDGLPLALELAAAGMRLVSPRGLLERITRQPRMLSSRLRDIPERHRTLWSTIAWSYDLLSEPERQMFRHVGIFTGACSPAAVQAILPAPASEMDVLDGLDALSTKSLLRVEHDPDGELCFRMLQTLREFARERLREDGEDEAAGRRHARYFVEFAERAEGHLFGAAQQAWLARVGREHDNLRAAIQFSVKQCEPEPALRLSGALWRFWWLRGHLHEGTYWLGQALGLPGDVPDAARAKSLHAAGKLARERGDQDQAEAFARERLAPSSAGRRRRCRTCPNIPAMSSHRRTRRMPSAVRREPRAAGPP
jgi:non-specific serine/threonine protein kinase